MNLARGVVHLRREGPIPYNPGSNPPVEILPARGSFRR